jgi:hypothetical protein
MSGGRFNVWCYPLRGAGVVDSARDDDAPVAPDERYLAYPTERPTERGGEHDGHGS